MIKKDDKKTIRAWSMYDWANSVYPLVITSTIFPVYYENVTSTEISDMVSLFGFEFKNTALYSYTISLSYLMIAVLSPFLSGIADYSGNKKSFMKFFCYLGGLSCASLYFFNAENLLLGLMCVFLASIGYSGSIVFYNAFLPEIASPEHHDRISAKGYALGYVGSSLLLIFNLTMVMFPDFYGIPEGPWAAKISFLTVGLWWIGFSQIPFRKLPDNVYGRKPRGNRFMKGYKELKKVFFQLKEEKRLRRYLYAFFVFSMGVQTVMLMAVMFGKKEVDGMTGDQLIITVLIIQFVAIGGAYFFSFLSERYIGNLKTLMVAVLFWVIICFSAYFVHTPVQFFVIAGAVGLVMGGIQSMARSTYAKFLPETIDHASYFSFYDVCEKVGIVLGTFSYGFIEEVTGSMRNSIFALAAFFLIGFVLLQFVPKKRMSKTN